MHESIVELEHVYAVVKGRSVLEDITFSVEQGGFIGIVGPNGAGKTTLLRLIMGLLTPHRGLIRVFGENPKDLTREKRKIGYLPQKINFDRRFPVSARDVVLMGTVRSRGFFRFPGPNNIKEAEEVMARMGISELKNRPIGELSGGQQQLVFLARALISKPKLLILDEPTAGLDPGAQDKFYKLIKELQGELNLTVLVVSHDLAAISVNAQRLICINKNMHMHGNPFEVVERLSKGLFHRCEFDVLYSLNRREDRS